MKTTLRTKFSIIALFFVISVKSQTIPPTQPLSEAYLTYIEQYKQIAIKQQKEHGIPASITLAQGLLESSAGSSPFAIASNNHFGIKCTDWTGEKIYHDDDAKGECFRKYDEVLQSYEDHSLFLKNKKRYAFLFELAPTDYQGWAFGLKKAGYATDPSYAPKLITLIENYSLHKYDLEQSDSISSNVNENNTKILQEKTEKQLPQKGYGSIGSISATVTHEVKKVNHVKFVTALPNDSYSAIADEFNLSEAQILEYNDLDAAPALTAGTRVFVAPKMNKAPKECPAHTVVEGESMRSISQDYGMWVVKLYQLNNMPFSDNAKPGQVLNLR